MVPVAIHEKAVEAAYFPVPRTITSLGKETYLSIGVDGVVELWASVRVTEVIL